MHDKLSAFHHHARRDPSKMPLIQPQLQPLLARLFDCILTVASAALWLDVQPQSCSAILIQIPCLGSSGVKGSVQCLWIISSCTLTDPCKASRKSSQLPSCLLPSLVMNQSSHEVRNHVTGSDSLRNYGRITVDHHDPERLNNDRATKLTVSIIATPVNRTGYWTSQNIPYGNLEAISAKASIVTYSIARRRLVA